MATATFRIWRGDATAGRVRRLHDRGRRGHGRARRGAPDPGRAGQRPGRALELQGGQVRLVLGRDQRQAAADVHDAAERRCDLTQPVTVEPMKAFPLDQGPGHRRVVELPRSRRRSRSSSRASPTRRTAPGACSRRTSTACRSSASASSASCARTSATCCATTTSTTSSSGRASWSTRRRSRCTRSTPRTALEELKDRLRHRLLQHHQVLHQGLPGGHHDHRQRDHSAQGARGRSVLRSDQAAVQHRAQVGGKVSRRPPSSRAVSGVVDRRCRPRRRRRLCPPARRRWPRRRAARARRRCFRRRRRCRRPSRTGS